MPAGVGCSQVTHVALEVLQNLKSQPFIGLGFVGYLRKTLSERETCLRSSGSLINGETRQEETKVLKLSLYCYSRKNIFL